MSACRLRHECDFSLFSRAKLLDYARERLFFAENCAKFIPSFARREAQNRVRRSDSYSRIVYDLKSVGMTKRLRHLRPIDQLPTSQRNKQGKRLLFGAVQRLEEGRQILASEMRDTLKGKYSRLLQSKLAPEIVWFCAQGYPPLSILRWLREQAPDEFGEEKVKQAALQSQITRLRREVLAFYEKHHRPPSVRDQPTLADLAGHEFNPLRQIELCILAQELRVSTGLEAEAHLGFPDREVGEELQRLARMLFEYVKLRKIIGLAPCESELRRQSPRVQRMMRTAQLVPAEMQKQLLKIYEYASVKAAALEREGEPPILSVED